MKFPILWLFLILALFHQLSIFKCLQNSSPENDSSPSKRREPMIPRRKTLSYTTKFDFKPFIKRRSRHRHVNLASDGQTRLGPPGGSDIDPRYGVEKRYVPSGPNRLHN
ncbi:hypothetical protein OROGR_014871 [Orobanche gracilis]